MTTALAPTAAGSTSVEELLRYAAHKFAAAGIEFRPPRMTRMIRSAGLDIARGRIDAYLDTLVAAAAASDRSWHGFELFVNGYADPTGAHATRNLDSVNAAALIRSRRAEAVNAQ